MKCKFVRPGFYSWTWIRVGDVTFASDRLIVTVVENEAKSKWKEQFHMFPSAAYSVILD